MYEQYYCISTLDKTTAKGIDVVDKGWRFKKDLRLVGIEFLRRGEKLREERSVNLSFNVRGGGERQRWS